MFNFNRNLQKIYVPLLVVGGYILSGCGPSLRLVRNSFYSYSGLSAEIKALESGFNNIIRVEEIGKTYGIVC